MAFPYIFHSNFEQGNNSEWDSETDTSAQMDFPHFTKLADTAWPTAVPYSGAYCMRTTLSGGTADAVLIEGDIDVADNTDRYVSFKMWFSPTFKATADDTVNVLELLASSTVEATLGFRVVAATDVINLGVGEVAPTVFSSVALKRGVWYTVEMEVILDESSEDNGTVNLFVTEEKDFPASSTAAATVGDLDQGGVTTSKFGVQAHLATTTGTILFDDFKFDDGRLHAELERPVTRWDKEISKTAHVFVGAGQIDDIILIPGAAADCTLKIYDTNAADSTDGSTSVAEVANTTASVPVNESNTSIRVKRGAYVVLGGTAPRARIRFSHTNGHGSVSMVKQLGKGVREA